MLASSLQMELLQKAFLNMPMQQHSGPGAGGGGNNNVVAAAAAAAAAATTPASALAGIASSNDFAAATAKSKPARFVSPLMEV